MREISHDALRYDYRCPECEGRISMYPVLDDNVVVGYTAWCNHCDKPLHAIKHTGEIRAEVIDTAKILNGLPDHIKELVRPSPDSETIANGAKALFNL